MNRIRIPVLIATLFWSVEALAQDVLIIHGSANYFPDVQSKIIGTGLFATVDLFNATNGTPSLATMESYDSVLIASDGGFQDHILLGDRTADYADGGGGVVVATFAYHTPGGALSLEGRIKTDGYLPYSGTGQANLANNTLLPVVVNHPILTGVNSFDSGSSGYINVITLEPGAEQVALYSDGVTELIATMQTNGTRVVGLNFYPPSTGIRADFWDENTDGDLIMANALDWAANACPLGDADNDGVCDFDDICPGFDDTADRDGDGNPDDCDPCPLDVLDDWDGDGVCDTDDICQGGDDAVDTDGDLTPDGCDLCPVDNPDDNDGDGECDSGDQCPGFSDVIDTDGDGTADGCDPCPLDAPDDTDLDGVCDTDDLCPGGDDVLDGDGDTLPDGCDH